jgi:C4-type Zn-finger protein
LISGIPHFKEVVIMATVCDFCGHKTNEVKSGGGIEPQGKKITLNVTESSDLSRDVLKVGKTFVKPIITLLKLQILNKFKAGHIGIST